MVLWRRTSLGQPVAWACVCTGVAPGNCLSFGDDVRFRVIARIAVRPCKMGITQERVPPVLGFACLPAAPADDTERDPLSGHAAVCGMLIPAAAALPFALDFWDAKVHSPCTMPAGLSKRWSDTKTAYKATTGDKKPREGMFNHTGLSGSFKDFDTAEEHFLNIKIDVGNNKKPFKDLEKAFATLQSKKGGVDTAVKSYMGNLDAALKKEERPDERTVLEKGLKWLKKELVAYQAIAAQFVAGAKQELDLWGKTVSIQEKQANIWEQNMASAIKKAIAAAAKAKMMALAAKTDAKKLPVAIKEFNGTIPNGTGRDVSMQMVNAKNVKGLTQASGAALRINTWKDQSRSADATATADQLLVEIKAFTADVKAVDAWYGSAIATKL
jgi:hypothetical protein